MPSFAASLPLLAGVLVLAHSERFPLSSVAVLESATPGAYSSQNNNGGAYPTATPTSPQPASVFVLTQVSAAPTVTGTAGVFDQGLCDEVAARITPQLTPKPQYPPALKAKADLLGGVQFDTCREVNLTGKGKDIDAAAMNSFTADRYKLFIVPIWAKVHELWQACGDKTKDIRAINADPCYRWALELSTGTAAGEAGVVAGGAAAGGNVGPNVGVNAGGVGPGVKADVGLGGANARFPQPVPSQTGAVAGAGTVRAVFEVAGLLALVSALVLV